MADQKAGAQTHTHNSLVKYYTVFNDGLMKKRWVIVSLTCLVTYAVLPVFAGAFKWGDRDGPVIYAQDYHAAVYRIGYAIADHGKPRSSMTWILYSRPIFYGFSRRVKDKGERERIINRLEENGAPISLLNRLREHQARFE